MDDDVVSYCLDECQCHECPDTEDYIKLLLEQLEEREMLTLKLEILWV